MVTISGLTTCQLELRLLGSMGGHWPGGLPALAVMLPIGTGDDIWYAFATQAEELKIEPWLPLLTREVATNSGGGLPNPSLPHHLPLGTHHILCFLAR